MHLSSLHLPILLLLTFPIMLPQRRKRKLDFFVVVGYNPSGKYIIIPSPARLCGPPFPHFNYIHVFSLSHKVGRMFLLFKLLVLLQLNKHNFDSEHRFSKMNNCPHYCSSSSVTKQKIRTAFIKNTAHSCPLHHNCVLYG